MSIKVNPETDLVLERIIDVPRHLVWEAWTRPELLMKWFCPLPWKTTDCEIELRPGGMFRTVMKGPEGQGHEGSGCYLEVVPNERLVWTDCLLPGFKPSANPFMTAMIVLQPHEKGTKYIAYACHKDAESKQKHEQMGFKEGWGMALYQMVAMIKSNL